MSPRPSSPLPVNPACLAIIQRGTQCDRSVYCPKHRCEDPTCRHARPHTDLRFLRVREGNGGEDRTELELEKVWLSREHLKILARVSIVSAVKGMVCVSGFGGLIMTRLK